MDIVFNHLKELIKRTTLGGSVRRAWVGDDEVEARCEGECGGGCGSDI